MLGAYEPRISKRMSGMKPIRMLLPPLLISIVIVGCATVPSLRIPQPWIRSLRSTQTIDPIAGVRVEVSGTSTPLLGNEQLTADRIRERLTYLLKRRGFSIESNSPECTVQLSYKTERSDKFRFSSEVTSTNIPIYAIATSSGAGATSGLGVSIARAISALASRSTTVSKQTAEQMLSYTHTISIELRKRQEHILWKGESTWDSDELNLIREIVPAIQLILSDLPSSQATRPEVSEVKSTHVLNYYKLECEGMWFTCPALPYRILFKEKEISSEAATSVPSNIENPHALAAYVDLIQTAEYALPAGDEKDWKDPIQASLWKRVTLGGQYLLGVSRKPANILIKLTGRADGYYIDECRVASDKEFSMFSTQFSKWKQALQEYYDVFAR